MTKPRTKLSEAPVVFGRRLTACKPIDSETRAWRAKFGDMVVRIADWSGEWTAEAVFRDVRLFDEFGTQESVTGKLQTFLKALKRAVVGVP